MVMRLGEVVTRRLAVMMTLYVMTVVLSAGAVPIEEDFGRRLVPSMGTMPDAIALVMD